MNARTEIILPAGTVRDAPPVAVKPLPTQMDPERLIMFALEKNVPMEQLERLLQLREKLLAEQAKEAFFDALSRFQSKCPVIKKKKKAKIQNKDDASKSFEYMYAPLDHIVKTVAPLLKDTGLSYTIVTRVEDKGQASFITAVCTVHHVRGHSEASDFTAPIDKTARMNDMQKFASAQSFAKRYAFQNAFGILTGDGDDDGNAGGAKSKATPDAMSAERATEGDDRPIYPDDGFAKNLPRWKALMENGKTLDDVLATAGTRYRFSDGQMLKLRAAAGVPA